MPPHFWIVAGVLVVLIVAYVCLYEYPTYRRMVRNPRPGYLYDRDKERLGL